MPMCVCKPMLFVVFHMYSTTIRMQATCACFTRISTPDNSFGGETQKNNYLKLLVKGYFLNFINIGVLAFWLGTVLVIGPTLNMNQNAIFVYFSVIIVSYFITDLGKIFLAKQLKNKMTPVVIYRVKKIMGITLIICGVFLILKGFIPNEKINEFIQ